jgi:hypothetical protein
VRSTSTLQIQEKDGRSNRTLAFIMVRNLNGATGGWRIHMDGVFAIARVLPPSSFAVCTGGWRF